MKTQPKLLYAGSDDELYHALSTKLTGDDCRWDTLNDPYQVVEHLRMTPSPESLTGDTSSLARIFRDRYAAVILDPEVPPESIAALLREIKEYDGGVPVIVIATQPVSLAISLARVDGAEACFIKPVEPLEPLVGAIRATVRKFERWEESLRAALVTAEQTAADGSPANQPTAN